MSKDKKKRILDKLVMGAVIGGAIGSVIGASIAPKEGKETREDLKEVAKTAKQSSLSLFHKIKGIMDRRKMKKVPHEED
ncbi:hypothetical protein COU74_02725 [Candidatus Peregrinibacteria bacterium CG10_big_fil_rev_8_21_14_0_10_36_19]|nr:MAG: hypothetical protein COU74_02725 [Candidatus Peregrinibacteria bacterium CG10_big_fil_rev_8_21_14_0_10_36_19]